MTANYCVTQVKELISQGRGRNIPSRLINVLNFSNLTKKIVRAAAIVVGVLCLLPSSASAQQFAVKTNILYDLTTTVNLGAELRVAPRWSIDLSGNYNAWNIDHNRLRHWLVQPEARYWFCDATAGHFMAFHLLGGAYNVGHLGLARDFLGVHFGNLRHNRYQGYFGGAGIGYGYSWILGKHWNIEAEIAVGWIHARYDKYECEGCGRKVKTATRDFVTPTKAAINLVYVF